MFRTLNVPLTLSFKGHDKKQQQILRLIIVAISQSKMLALNVYRSQRRKVAAKGLVIEL